MNGLVGLPRVGLVQVNFSKNPFWSFNAEHLIGQQMALIRSTIPSEKVKHEENCIPNQNVLVYLR